MDERTWHDWHGDGVPVIDGRDPKMIEHLCINDLQIHDGPVEECCLDRWREERAALG
jgi:hypothetical protein